MKKPGYIRRETIERLILRLEELLPQVPKEFRDDIQFVLNMFQRNPPDMGSIKIYLDQEYRW